MLIDSIRFCSLYSPAKVLLLDDVLSAVDSHTAQHLFNHVLNGPITKGRTCILGESFAFHFHQQIRDSG
jgi:ABC-type Mn2+/Zn2+ transport system ATPase subunit